MEKIDCWNYKLQRLTLFGERISKRNRKNGRNQNNIHFHRRKKRRDYKTLMKNFDYSTYLSPFTWRYGTEEMRKIWSEMYKRKIWRKVWVELAKAQYDEGLISKDELEDIIQNRDKIDIEKA